MMSHHVLDGDSCSEDFDQNDVDSDIESLENPESKVNEKLQSMLNSSNSNNSLQPSGQSFTGTPFPFVQGQGNATTSVIRHNGDALTQANAHIGVLTQALRSAQRQVELLKEENRATSKSLNWTRLKLSNDKAGSTSIRLTLQKVLTPHIKFVSYDDLLTDEKGSIGDRVMNDLEIPPLERTKWWGDNKKSVYYYMVDVKTKICERLKKRFIQGNKQMMLVSSFFHTPAFSHDET